MSYYFIGVFTGLVYGMMATIAWIDFRKKRCGMSKDDITRGLNPQVLQLNCTDEMKVLVAKLIFHWEKEGHGKLAPSKALKKLNYAKSHGCPLLKSCMDCKNVKQCPLLSDDSED